MDSDLIALASAFVAILSAIYARRAVREANIANKIAVQDKRLEIYDAFQALWLTIQQNGCLIEHKHIAGYSIVIKDYAHMYFDKTTVDDLNRYTEIAFQLATLNRKSSRSGISDAQIQDVYDSQDSLFEEESNLYQSIKKTITSQMIIV